jgi:hypothetical protein
MSSGGLLKKKPFGIRDNQMGDLKTEPKQQKQPNQPTMSKYALVFLNDSKKPPAELRKQTSQSALTNQSKTVLLERKKVISTSQLQKSLNQGAFVLNKSKQDQDDDEDALLANLDTNRIRKESVRSTTKQYAHMIRKTPPKPKFDNDSDLENELSSLNCNVMSEAERRERDQAIQKAMRYAEILKAARPTKIEPVPPETSTTQKDASDSDDGLGGGDDDDDDLFGLGAAQAHEEEVEKKRKTLCSVHESDSDVIEIEEAGPSKLNSRVWSSSGDTGDSSEGSPHSSNGRARAKMTRKRSVTFDYEAVEENPETDAEIDTAR